MNPIDNTILQDFLTRIGKTIPEGTNIYLLGGSALYLIGNPRVTNDIDYTFDTSPGSEALLDPLIQNIAKQMNIYVESVPIGEFIPLPADFFSRRKYFGQFEKLQVYIFDLYSIAISKISRGFDSDIEDVIFLLEKGFIEFDWLEKMIEEISPKMRQSDIDPKEFNTYQQELRKQWKKRK